jgi:hypothetical protein
MVTCITVLLTKYYLGDRITKNYMCGACGTYGERDHFRGIGLGGMIIVR